MSLLKTHTYAVFFFLMARTIYIEICRKEYILRSPPAFSSSVHWHLTTRRMLSEFCQVLMRVSEQEVAAQNFASISSIGLGINQVIFQSVRWSQHSHLLPVLLCIRMKLAKDQGLCIFQQRVPTCSLQMWERGVEIFLSVNNKTQNSKCLR